MTAFDPTLPPDPSDITGIGVRLGTVASVLSSFYAAAPTTGLIENLRNTELLDVWPLRDPISLEAVELLRGVDDRSWDLHAQWHAIFGFNGLVPLTVPDDVVEHADDLSSLYAAAGFTSPQVADLPGNHIATLLAFSGHLATHVAMQWRQGEDVTGTGTQLRGLVDRELSERAGAVIEGIEAASVADTFRAVAGLTRGYMDVLTSFAATVAGNDY